MVLRYIATFLLLLSGLTNYLDKLVYFFDIKLDNNFGFNSSADFAYALSVTISPILISVASFFKPFKIGYLFPLYVYLCDLSFWLFSSNKTDYGYSYIYGAIFTLLFAFSFILLRKRIKVIENAKHKNIALEELLELSIEIISKKNK